MATKSVQFTIQKDGLHLAIPSDVISQVTSKENSHPDEEDVEKIGKMITAALNSAGLAPGPTGEGVGLAFAAALIRLREDIYSTDTGNGVEWTIGWNVFGHILHTASTATRQLGAFPTTDADLVGEMRNALHAWHITAPSTAL